MSADFINGIGPRSPGPREAYGLGARPTPPTGSPAVAKSEAPSAPAGASEGFSPTAEAGETAQDQQAGAARASQFFSAWDGGSTPPVASTGVLDVKHAENTSVDRVHAGDGSPGPQAGFSGATVYSSKPPQT